MRVTQGVGKGGWWCRFRSRGETRRQRDDGDDGVDGGLRWCGVPDSVRRGTMAMEGGPGEQYSGRWDDSRTGRRPSVAGSISRFVLT